MPAGSRGAAVTPNRAHDTDAAGPTGDNDTDLGLNRPDGDTDPPVKSERKPVDDVDLGPGIYVIVAQPREGNQIVEVHSEETAEARVHALTYNSKQHRKALDEAGDALPEGGGSHEINRDDVKVYRLNASEFVKF